MSIEKQNQINDELTYKEYVEHQVEDSMFTFCLFLIVKALLLPWALLWEWFNRQVWRQRMKAQRRIEERS